MSGPVLDPAVIDRLRQLTPPGEPEVLKEILQVFLDDVPGRISRLRAAWQAGDLDEVRRTAHSLKGSAGNIGASHLLDVCRQLDDHGKARDLSHLPTLVTALDAEYARVAAAIHQLIT